MKLKLLLLGLIVIEAFLLLLLVIGNFEYRPSRERIVVAQGQQPPMDTKTQRDPRAVLASKLTLLTWVLVDGTLICVVARKIRRQSIGQGIASDGAERSSDAMRG